MIRLLDSIAACPGDTLFILEVMKMEVPYEAPIAGSITSLTIAEGDAVQEADIVAEIS